MTRTTWPRRGLLVMAMLVLSAGITAAQTGLRSPGKLSGVGDSGASRSLVANSFGVGSLSSYTPAGPGGDVLRSSLSVGGLSMREGVATDLTVAPLSAQPGRIGAPVPLSQAPAMDALAAPAGPTLNVPPPPSAAPAMNMPRAPGGNQFSQDVPLLASADVAQGGEGAYGPAYDPTTGFAQLYLSAISQQGALEQQAGPVKSLAPPGGTDRFAQHMKDGELAMKQRNYRRASEQFELAYILDRQSPEALLGLVHARLAMAQGSYRQPGWYLEQAIRYLPELPLIHLNLPAMFAPPDELHTGVLPPLLRQAAENPRDVSAYMLLAYVLWFDSNPSAAQDALAIARQAATAEDTTEAIDTFWDGMLASGLVSGDLQPNRQLHMQGLVVRADEDPGATGPQP